MAWMRGETYWGRRGQRVSFCLPGGGEQRQTARTNGLIYSALQKAARRADRPALCAFVLELCMGGNTGAAIKRLGVVLAEDFHIEGARRLPAFWRLQKRAARKDCSAAEKERIALSLCSLLLDLPAWRGAAELASVGLALAQTAPVLSAAARLAELAAQEAAAAAAVSPHSAALERVQQLAGAVEQWVLCTPTRAEQRKAPGGDWALEPQRLGASIVRLLAAELGPARLTGRPLVGQLICEFSRLHCLAATTGSTHRLYLYGAVWAAVVAPGTPVQPLEIPLLSAEQCADMRRLYGAEPAPVPDYALDKHTSVGRSQLRRGLEHFLTEGVHLHRPLYCPEKAALVGGEEAAAALGVQAASKAAYRRWAASGTACKSGAQRAAWAAQQAAAAAEHNE